MSRYVEARCPLRPADKCSLCTPGADGPHNCGLVYLMVNDEELQELYAEDRRRARASTAPGRRLGVAKQLTATPGWYSISMSR